MTETHTGSGRDPSMTRTLAADLKEIFHSVFGGEVKRPVSRNFRDLREFYLDEKRRKRLASMSRTKRWFLTGFWLLSAARDQQ